jgi:hypothetical protein
MVTCPWCGTSSQQFQSNCTRCSGPLPPSAEAAAFAPPAGAAEENVLMPTHPPRPISNSYVWRLMLADGWAISGLVFGLLGGIFTLVGGALTLALITAFVGLPFLAVGLVFLGAAAAVVAWRYQVAHQAVEVLKTGQAAIGQIERVEENFNVRVNGRHPWTITYQFQALGRAYEGQVTTLNLPGPGMQAGEKACVLYLPNTPEHNGLYPHP